MSAKEEFSIIYSPCYLMENFQVACLDAEPSEISKRMQDVLDTWPTANRSTIAYFLAHLARVAQHADVNAMDVRNLAKVSKLLTRNRYYITCIIFQVIYELFELRRHVCVYFGKSNIRLLFLFRIFCFCFVYFANDEGIISVNFPLNKIVNSSAASLNITEVLLNLFFIVHLGFLLCDCRPKISLFKTD